MFGNNSKTNVSNTKTKTNGSILEVCNIAQGTTIEGTVKVDSNIRLERLIHGDVTCGGRLVMSSTAKIIGDIICKNIISEGIVEGNIVAKEKIHITDNPINMV